MSCVGLMCFTCRASITYRTIALTGDAAPNTNTGVVYSSFSKPIINSSGQVAFWGKLAGPGVINGNDHAIWAEDAGILRMIARNGDRSPGTPLNIVFDGLQVPSINEAGHIVFRATLTGGSVNSGNNLGIWSDRNGSLELVIRTGELAPGTGSGVVFSSLNGFKFNRLGQTAYSATIVGTGVNRFNDEGVWSENSGTLDIVAREGSNAPDTNVQFGSSPLGTTASLGLAGFSNTSNSTLSAYLVGPGVNGSNDRGVWTESNGQLELIVREGDIAPGAGFGTSFRNLGFSSQSNNVGQHAFWSGLAGPSVNDTNDGSIWFVGNGNMSLVARTGSPISGAEPNVFFADLADPLLNNSGQLAFIGVINGPSIGQSKNSIALGNHDSLGILVREDDTAPGTPTGIVYESFNRLALNGTGQIAFMGQLTGSGISGVNNDGIWATNPSGEIKLIARENDIFDVNGDPLIDDFRTIQSLNLISASNENEGTSFNDAGQLVFQLSFTDGTSGIFVATIPEPGTLGLLGVGMGLVAGRRGKRVA